MNIFTNHFKSLTSFLFNITLSLLISISSIYIFTLIFVKSTFLYHIYADNNKLAESTKLSTYSLYKNYDILTDFISTPLNSHLSLPDFSISDNAMIHFYDVKNIFSALLYISIITITILSSYIIFSFLLKRRISTIFIKAVPIELISFCTVISIAFTINFQKCFILFHKLLFKNDYWLFDPEVDKVINILPENFFMIAAIAILICLTVESIIIILFLKKLHKIDYIKFPYKYKEL